MSWFGSGAAKLDMEAVEKEYNMVQSIFSNVQEACMPLCVSSTYIQPDISKGEATCLDRCVSKFLQTATKIALESRSQR